MITVSGIFVFGAFGGSSFETTILGKTSVFGLYSVLGSVKDDFEQCLLLVAMG